MEKHQNTQRKKKMAHDSASQWRATVHIGPSVLGYACVWCAYSPGMYRQLVFTRVKCHPRQSFPMALIAQQSPVDRASGHCMFSC